MNKWETAAVGAILGHAEQAILLDSTAGYDCLCERLVGVLCWIGARGSAEDPPIDSLTEIEARACESLWRLGEKGVASAPQHILHYFNLVHTGQARDRMCQTHDALLERVAVALEEQNRLVRESRERQEAAGEAALLKLTPIVEEMDQ